MPAQIKERTSNKPQFNRGELLTNRNGVVFLVTLGNVDSFNAVAIRHGNYPYGTNVHNIDKESGDWQLFRGEVVLTNS